MRSALLCCSAMMVAGPALGQVAVSDTSPRHKSSGLEEVVVQARRVKENLQHVPVAVTSLSRTDLRNRQIQNVSDLTNEVPNVTIQPQFGDPSTPFITIRGFSNGTLSPSVDSPIGLYVDDVYLGRAVGSAFDLSDLSSIELLRGPQGTLFGRNATGGAISLHTAAPTGKLDAHLETTFGNYGEKRVRASLDTPTYDGFSMRISVLHDSNDGYVTRSSPSHTYALPAPFGNITSADDYGANDRTGVSAAIRYDPTEALRFDYRFDYTHAEQSQLAVQGLGYEAGDGFIKLLGESQAPGSVPVSLSRLGSLPLSFETPGTLDTIGNSLTATYKVNDHLSLKSITSYRTQRQDTGGNEIDGGQYVGDALSAATIGVPIGEPYTPISGIARRAQHQVSEEFQLIGQTGNVEWLAGGYYFNEIASQNDAILSAFFGNGILTTAGLSQAFGPTSRILGALDAANNSSYAGYAHATVHLTDQWDIAGGMRYTSDARDYYHNNPGNVFSTTVNNDNTDYDASVTYKITPNASVYGKVATAFLSGGAISTFTFEPEHNTSYELGLRSQFFDNRARVNLTFFDQNITGLQVTEFDIDHGTYIINGGNESVPGVELEVAIKPTLNSSLGLTYGHTRAPDNINPVNGLAIPSLYASDNLGITGDYSTEPLYKDTYLSFHVDTSWTSGHPNIATLPTNPADAALFNATTSPAEWNVNARVTLNDIQLGPTKARLSAWVRNLADNKGISFAREVFFTVGTFDIPRTYGVDLAVDF